MQLDPTSEKPIFLQLAEVIEDNILKGIYAEETQIPSTTEVAVALKVNPATVNHGVNQLVDDGIVYKKRGVGMFVCSGARAQILARRKQTFTQDFINPMLAEAKNLGLSHAELADLLKQATSPVPAERKNLDEQH
jgi:DNA-binding transcriptional regulator YhcF (GntR family)